MPTRMCIACRNKKEKKDLLRIVATNSVAMLDKDGKQNTRGIYICNDKKCINKLLNSKDISKCIKIKTNEKSVKELLKNLED